MTYVIDTQENTRVQQRTLPLERVTLTGGMWYTRQQTNQHVSLDYGFDALEATGALDNFRIAAGRLDSQFQGMRFQDSDAYKWLEAAAFVLAAGSNPALQAKVDLMIELIEATQDSDGYLNTFYQVTRPRETRWTAIDHDHELYCAGHLIQAAVAHHRATGSMRLLNVVLRLVDHIDAVFGPGKLEAAPGHPEIEMALVELYRDTGDEKHLRLAQFFVDQRGKNVMQGAEQYSHAYYQDRVPVRETDRVEGHAVRALYLTAGITDIVMETGEDALYQSLLRQWHDMTTRKLYITGGVGSRPADESFGEPYELPDDTDYCETCAAIASIMWNWRMLLLTGEARYAHLMERTLYNGFLSGVGLDGTTFFYDNPLRATEQRARHRWFACACCPPNVMRLLASIHSYLATVSDGTLHLHHYAASTIDADLPNVGRVCLSVDTDYPYEGRVRLVVDETPDAEWTLRLRLPDWCAGALLRVNDDEQSAQSVDGYIVVARRWQAGDVVLLDLPMSPRLTAAHPLVSSAGGTVAVERGPLVYCLEQVDQPDGVDVGYAQLVADAPIEVVALPDVLGGTVALDARGFMPDTAVWTDALYLPYSGVRLNGGQDVDLRFVPYCLWANRSPSAMRVWTRVRS